MTDFLKYNIGSRSFLERAEEHIAQFESSRSVAAFFYAALQLRFGIEARLQEYLDATLRQRGSQADRSSEPAATKLLRRLSAIAPESEYATQLRIVGEQSGSETNLRYTPVTRRLAKMHGRLGALLHFKVFARNRSVWFIDAPLEGGDGTSLVTHLEFLRNVAEELRSATGGTLLTHPAFTQLVEAFVNNPEQVK